MNFHNIQTALLMGDELDPPPKPKKKRAGSGTIEMSNLKDRTKQELKEELIKRTKEVFRHKATIKGLRIMLDSKQVGIEQLRRKYNEIAGLRRVG